MENLASVNEMLTDPKTVYGRYYPDYQCEEDNYDF